MKLPKQVNGVHRVVSQPVAGVQGGVAASINWGSILGTVGRVAKAAIPAALGAL